MGKDREPFFFQSYNFFYTCKVLYDKLCIFKDIAKKKSFVPTDVDDKHYPNIEVLESYKHLFHLYFYIFISLIIFRRKYTILSSKKTKQDDDGRFLVR